MSRVQCSTINYSFSRRKYSDVYATTFDEPNTQAWDINLVRTIEKYGVILNKAKCYSSKEETLINVSVCLHSFYTEFD